MGMGQRMKHEAAEKVEQAKRDAAAKVAADKVAADKAAADKAEEDRIAAIVRKVQAPK